MRRSFLALHFGSAEPDVIFKKMKTETWIDDENLIAVADAVAWLADHNITDEEKTEISNAAKHVNEEKNIWHTQQFRGKFEIKLSFSLYPGSSNYSLKIESETNIEQGLKPIIALAQSYRITEI